MSFDKRLQKPYEGAELAQNLACEKTPIRTSCLTILMNLNFSSFFGYNF